MNVHFLGGERGKAHLEDTEKDSLDNEALVALDDNRQDYSHTPEESELKQVVIRRGLGPGVTHMTAESVFASGSRCSRRAKGKTATKQGRKSKIL